MPTLKVPKWFLKSTCVVEKIVKEKNNAWSKKVGKFWNLKIYILVIIKILTDRPAGDIFFSNSGIPWYTVHDLNLSRFFQKIKKKCENLGTFTQKVSFLDYNKTNIGKKCDNLEKVWQFGKKWDNLEQSVTIWNKVWLFGTKCDNLEKNVTIWGHELY